MSKEARLPARLPGNAIDPEGADVVAPTVAVLEELYLLPTQADLDAAGGPLAVLGGQSQSVAVIESTAMAISKWWAALLGMTVPAGWVAVAKFWDEIAAKDAGPIQMATSQRTFMLAVAIASAAAILSIGYIVGTDIRARASASAATIAARQGVAQTVMQLARGRDSEEQAALTITEIQPRAVKYLTKGGEDESGWVAIALQSKLDGSERKFLVVKGSEDAWAGTAELQFITS